MQSRALYVICFSINCMVQIQRANYFEKICEEQLSTQRFLETEIENLKMMQAQTERRKLQLEIV